MSSRKKLLFIYNQKAGKSTIKTNLAAVIEMFTKAGYDVTAHPTQGIGDAARVAKECTGDYDLLVCAGGDGTLGETAAGVYRSGTKTPIGYLPSGSTNDYAASIGLPKNIKDAVNTVLTGKPKGFDFGNFNDRNFLYVAAFGWFTDVSYATDQNLKNVFGHGAYVLEAGKRLFSMPQHHIKVVSGDRKIEDDVVYGMVTNSNSVGGMKGFGWRTSDLSDGLFEVTLVLKPKNLVELSECVGSLLNGEPYDKVLRFKTDRIEIDSDEEIKWSIDGEESNAYSHVVIENIQKAINVIVDDK